MNEQVPAPKYDPSEARTIAAAMGLYTDAHGFVLTDASTGRTKGVYANQQQAGKAFLRLSGLLADNARPSEGGVYVMTVLHPEQCGCSEDGGTPR